MYSCWSMSKMPSPSLHMESLARCMEGCIFPVPEEDACSFFNMLFDIVWVVYDYLFTSQRKSHSVIKLPKLTWSISMEITLVVLVDQFYFYMH